MSEIGLKVDLRLDDKKAHDDLNSFKSKLKNEKIKIEIDTKSNGLKSLSSDLALATRNIEKATRAINGVNGKSLDKAFESKGIKESTQSLTKLTKEFERYEKQIVGIKKKQEDLFNRGKNNEALALNEQIQLLNKLQSEIKKDVNPGLKKAYDEATKSIRESYQEVQRVNSAINDGKAWDRVSNDIDKAKSRIEKFRTEFKHLSDTESIADKLSQSLREIGNSSNVREAANDVEKLTKELKQAENSAEQVTREMRNMSTSMSMVGKFGQDFKSHLFTFTAGELLADGIRNITRELGTLVMEWDRSMANLKKVANFEDVMNVSQLDAISQKAIQIAKNVGMASSDVVQAIADTIQMGGYSMEEATKVAEQTMMLANVAEMTAEQASQGVVTMMSAFKLDPMKEVPVVVNGVTKSVDELTNAMDKINYVGNNFAISSSGIVESIQNGANVLSEYGVSMTDTIAMIAAANTTLQNPNKVGNGLKSIATNLAGIKASAKDGSLELNKTAKTLKEVAGIDIFADKKKGEIKDMSILVEELASKWDSFNDMDKAGISESIAGKQQAAVFQSLMSNMQVMKDVQSELNQGWHFGSALAEKQHSPYVQKCA